MSSTTSTAGFSASYIAYNEGHTLARISYAMIPISGIITAARFWSRKRKHISYGWDDWLTLISLPSTGAALEETWQWFWQKTKCLFMTEIVYGTCLCTIKAAILLMYRRIFPTRLMEIGGWCIGAITIAFWLAGILVSVFQCRPIRKTWDPFMEGGTCLNKYQFFLGSSISNIITDAFMLILPVLEVLRLQIRFGQKIAIAGIFLLGSFTPSNKSGDTSELVTIGGGTNLKHSAKPKVRDSFMRLHGNDSTEEPVLWPSTYAGDLATTIEGAQDDSSSTQAAIPLDTIKVQKAITWVESKPNV
ncbi:integral membrane protein [Grosmannia clavigera kw1407]|uniref:Integral membrane protein n=1 Tax=Grosmannia clavigera (strain kw1407 / UAMH 11150) TaxID=655863 RepID=F0XAM8_GROCL|nr:uncharacterized protein CMQ_3445 [Grosmannia clavigera kw1407]EFX05376.1 integral membrane protein [Grosmannia clavigera kw1407]